MHFDADPKPQYKIICKHIKINQALIKSFIKVAKTKTLKSMIYCSLKLSKIDQN